MSSDQLIKQLQDAKLYPHKIHGFKVIETHISWVILTGDFAYKIKKPMDFGFLNFTELDKRRFYCEEEVRLNHVLTDDIYLEVIPITGSEANPELDGKGDIIEYAIKMREFPQDKILLNLYETNHLKLIHIEKLGKIVADFHAKAAQDSSDYFGTPEQVNEPVVQNFEQITPFLTHPQELDTLIDYAKQAYQTLFTVFQQRKQLGFIRECHGDLHLGNIVLLKDQPTIFDCIEFNDSFRFTDTMADVGFLVMDLLFHKLTYFANRFLNTYLDYSFDYEGLKVLAYYINYRAIVRAKISLLEMSQLTDEAGKARKYQTYKDYMQLAFDVVKPKPQKLIITHGVSGSGKSFIAKITADHLQAIHIRSDIIRKHLAHRDINQSAGAPLNSGIYSQSMTQKTYEALLELAEQILQTGYSVIVDATFLQQVQREAFSELSKKLNVSFHILGCTVPKVVVEQWLEHRRINEEDHSDARVDILHEQYEQCETLTADEKPYSISFARDKLFTDKQIIAKIDEVLS